MAQRGRPKKMMVQEAEEERQTKEDTQIVVNSPERTIEICSHLIGEYLNSAINRIDAMISFFKASGKGCQRFIQAKYDLQKIQKRLK